MTELLKVGDCIKLDGRFQSRAYSRGVAYEVSIIKVSAGKDYTGL